MENKRSQQGKVAVVTGSSSGIGFETSLLLARKGFYTYATMRNLNKSQKINDVVEKENLPLKVLQLDVTDDKSVKDAIRQITDESSRIDVLVNNAGYGVMGAVEDLSLDQFKSQFETNFFGVIRVTKEVIPIMRNQGNGNIINVSSIGGKIGLPLNSAYISSKFAIEGLSESMRYELEQFGIDVILIEPGVVKTNFFENVDVVVNNNDNNTSTTNNITSPYSQLTQKLFEGFEPMLNSSSSSVSYDVAEVIYQAIVSKNRDVRYPVGKDAVSIIKTRQNLSDKELEYWIKESIFQQKGFIH
ncbi:MAG TPA: SDR family oxidoreductase [Nitrososphaeraceae archaeon]|nr:SDR family oxidoreductase [Nitrososphaeraceae archaeon]